MLRLITRLIIGLALSGNVGAQGPQPVSKTAPAKAPTTAPAKKSVSTDIYQQDQAESDPHEGLKTLKAKVKVVRDDGEGREVFFTSDKVSGAFYLRRSVEHYGKYLKILEDSKKPQGSPISIRYDENQIIKSVEGSAPAAGSAGHSDSDEKWNFGEVPE